MRPIKFRGKWIGGAETGRWVYEICQLNPGIDPGRLQPGQKVRVP